MAENRGGRVAARPLPREPEHQLLTMDARQPIGIRRATRRSTIPRRLRTRDSDREPGRREMIDRIAEHVIADLSDPDRLPQSLDEP